MKILWMTGLFFLGMSSFTSTFTAGPADTAIAKESCTLQLLKLECIKAEGLATLVLGKTAVKQ